MHPARQARLDRRILARCSPARSPHSGCGRRFGCRAVRILDGVVLQAPVDLQRAFPGSPAS
jgi:hypothetical protein